MMTFLKYRMLLLNVEFDYRVLSAGHNPLK